MQRIILLVLAIASGSLAAQSQNVVKVQTGAILKTTGGATITLLDMNLDNDGTIDQSSFRFNGTANNTISGTSTPIFDLLEIAKTGSAKLSLNRGITISSSLQFSSGLIDLNNNNILLQPGALLNGESETSRIIGPTGGYVEITKNLNNPSSANPGNLGALITSTQNLGNTTIRRGHTVQSSGGGLSTSIQRYFDIVPTNNAALNATFRFRYFDAELNGLDENTLVMWKSTDNVVWTNQGFTNRDAAGNYVEKNGLADFSRWTLSTAFNSPLPVQFVLFNVKCEGSRVMIHWKTAQEINASHFEVQRSSNGSDWTTIGTLQAAGNSSLPQSYSFIDNSPLLSGALYRIAEFDLDGKKQYTSINRADCGNVETWKAWPNPVDQQLFLTISVVNGSQAMIRLFDSRGALLREQRNTLMSGSNQLNVDMQRLPAGTYHVVATWDNGQTQRSVKIIKR
jgi:hypothetical protein